MNGKCVNNKADYTSILYLSIFLFQHFFYLYFLWGFVKLDFFYLIDIFTEGRVMLE